jgi:hypothetical protein
MECGFFPEEIEHVKAGKHTYAEWRIFSELSLVLCNFCYVDFGSYDPTFFGCRSAHVLTSVSGTSPETFRQLSLRISAVLIAGIAYLSWSLLRLRESYTVRRKRTPKKGSIHQKAYSKPAPRESGRGNLL